LLGFTFQIEEESIDVQESAARYLALIGAAVGDVNWTKSYHAYYEP